MVLVASALILWAFAIVAAFGNFGLGFMLWLVSLVMLAVGLTRRRGTKTEETRPDRDFEVSRFGEEWRRHPGPSREPAPKGPDRPEPLQARRPAKAPPKKHAKGPAAKPAPKAGGTGRHPLKVTEFRFFSLYSYMTESSGHADAESRAVRDDLKGDRIRPSGVHMSEEIARKLGDNLEEYGLSGYFGPDTALVPVPKSTSRNGGRHGVPEKMTDAMEGHGLGRSCPRLIRTCTVPKSSASRSGNRPRAWRHYDSMRVENLGFDPRRIVLVDDVITKGATLMGAVNRLAEAYPGTEILVFAAMRALWHASSFVSVERPFLGRVGMRGGETYKDDSPSLPRSQESKPKSPRQAKPRPRRQSRTKSRVSKVTPGASKRRSGGRRVRGADEYLKNPTRRNDG